MSLEKKTYNKFLVRKVITDVYLGKWHRIKSLKRYILPRIPFTPQVQGRVLEIGAGDGILSFFLAQKYPNLQITCTELNQDQASANRWVAEKVGLKNVSFKSMDLLNPDEKGPFDYLFILEVFEHILDHEKAAAQCFSLLKPGGTLIASVPNKLSLNEHGQWIPSPGPDDHVRTGYHHEELQSLLQGAGFEVSFRRYCLRRPMILAWRLFSRLDKFGRPFTLLGMPWYLFCFLRENEENPPDGNVLWMVARKPM